MLSDVPPNAAIDKIGQKTPRQELELARSRAKEVT